MATIDRNNYQAFILDYYEGSLPAEKQAELLLFIENHPELKAEFSNFEMITLASVKPEAFPAKDSLVRKITEETVQHYLVARHEGDLSLAESRELEEFLAAHPPYRRDEQLFAMARLQPDPAVVFPGRQSLKKHAPVGRMRPAAYMVYAAAACLAVLVGVYFFRDDNRHEQAQRHEMENSPVRIHSSGDNMKKKAAELVEQEDNTTNKMAKEKTPPAPRIRPQRQYQKPSMLAKHDSPANNHTPVPSENHPSHGERLSAYRPAVFVHDIAPELIRDKLAEEISADPSAFDEAKFDAFLDRISDPDSALSIDAFREPVFAKQNTVEQPARAPGGTPMLSALAWGMSRLTNDVTLQRNFNDDGRMVAYSIEAGKLRFGKQDPRQP